MSKERFARLRKIYKQKKAEVEEKREEIIQSRLEKGDNVKKAASEHSPLFANYDHLSDEEKEKMFKANVVRAEIRKRVSKAMYEEDKNLAPAEQYEIAERQVNRFYDFKINQPKLRAHVEAPHGTKASDKVEKWSEDNKISDYETNTNEITAETTNWMIFNKPRLIADVNSLPADVESSLRSEGAVYTKEDNLNAVKAQRDLTAHLLKEQNNLDGNGKAKNPYLAVYIHGKVDTRGHDFEIAAKQENGKGPLNPLLAFWVAEKLKEKVAGKGLKNLKGETPTVNVVTYKGAYSGSPALTRLRHGDDVFDFKGFGENFHALQLEVGAHLRKTQQPALSSILNELMIDFSEEFKTPQDMEKLKKYAEAYGQKLQKEKDELFSTKNLGFSDEIPEGRIALSKALREALEVDKGDTITVNGKELKVMMMKAADMKSGKTMMINTRLNELAQTEKLQIEVPGKEKNETKEQTELLEGLKATVTDTMENLQQFLAKGDRFPLHTASFSDAEKIAEKVGNEKIMGTILLTAMEKLGIDGANLPKPFKSHGNERWFNTSLNGVVLGTDGSDWWVELAGDAKEHKGASSQSEELKKGWKYFGKMILTKIRELLPWGKH